MSSAPSYEHETFLAATLDDGAPQPRTAAWLQSVAQGFNAEAPSSAQLRRRAGNLERDGALLTAVFPAGDRSGLDGLGRPVATLLRMEGELAVGGAVPLAARMITSVTVRPAHRRRGILRSMMEPDLREAAGAGVPIVLLTVTEGSIYRRFGFGTAVRSREVRVDTGARFALQVRPSGRVEAVGTEWLHARMDAVFEAFHARTPGSVTRRCGWTDYVFQDGGDEFDRAVRAAVHLDETGALDGYVAYTAKGDFSARELTVHDLVAASDDAYLALWQHLAAIDLAASAVFESAPVDDPLLHALVDQRVVTTTALYDDLWARVLDPAAVLEARGYSRLAREAGLGLVLRVRDGLGIVSGDWSLRLGVTGAAVERLPEGEADLELDVAELAPIVLGGATPSALAAAGLVRELRPGALETADAIFQTGRAPYFHSHF